MRPFFTASSKTRLLISVLTLFSALVFGGFVFAGWAENRKVTYVIPPGTRQNLEASRHAVEFPDEIVLTLGVKDTIIIENQDDVVHIFGPFVVAPHSTLTKRFDVPTVYEGACTFHQDKQMRLVVRDAPWNFFRN